MRVLTCIRFCSIGSSHFFCMSRVMATARSKSGKSKSVSKLWLCGEFSRKYIRMIWRVVIPTPGPSGAVEPLKQHSTVHQSGRQRARSQYQCPFPACWNKARSLEHRFSRRLRHLPSNLLKASHDERQTGLSAIFAHRRAGAICPPILQWSSWNFQKSNWWNF